MFTIKIKYFPLRAFLSQTHFHYLPDLLISLQKRDLTRHKDRELKPCRKLLRKTHQFNSGLCSLHISCDIKWLFCF